MLEQGIVRLELNGVIPAILIDGGMIIMIWNLRPLKVSSGSRAVTW